MPSSGAAGHCWQLLNNGRVYTGANVVASASGCTRRRKPLPGQFSSALPSRSKTNRTSRGRIARDGGALENCPGSGFRLRVQPEADATTLAPVYTLPLFNSCQQWPAAPLDGIHHLQVTLQRLPNNYALAHEAKLVVQRPHATPFGELLVHADTCDGAALARGTLPDPAHSPHTLHLDAPITPPPGRHDLCFVLTAPTDGPLHAFDRVQLGEGKP